MIRRLAVPATVYRPREPAESDFHRLVRLYFDDFRAVYGARYARQLGYWRPVIDQAVGKFLKCGDLAHGFARVRCGDCGHDFLVAFSCKQRCICPSCVQKRTLVFGLHLADEVCRFVPHRQFVWTMPKRLRVFFRFHRGLLGRLPPLAWETVREVYAALLGPEATPGGIIGIQTFGSLLHFHPHLHALITDGAFTAEGHFRPLPANLTHEPFVRLWEQKVFQLLVDEGLMQPAVVQQMRSWRHSGFHVDRSVVLARGDRKGIEQLGQYLARCPFSLARLVRITEEGKVLYKADKERCQEYPEPVSEDLRGGAARNYQVFEPLDFLAELTQHIPNKGEHLVRYYGCYSNKARRKKAGVEEAAPEMGGQGGTGAPGTEARGAGESETKEGQAARRRWAMLIQRVYEVDPLVCPKCGGAMTIIAFMEARQDEVIRKILEHCGLWRDPPPRRAARSPARAANAAIGRLRSAASSDAVEMDPDYLEHRRREQEGAQLNLPWD
jgi:hypothetical protein